jgi:16S rRNA (cytosine1402-N4)-methyltransferase
LSIVAMMSSDPDQLHGSDQTGSAGHIPVMPGEVLDGLSLRPGLTVIDGTFGGGGHARLIADRIVPGGFLIAIDRDADASDAFDQLEREYPSIGEFYQGSYARMQAFAAASGYTAVDRILLDLGMSSLQLADAGRGFSFQSDGPLDMRFDRQGGPSAADLINARAEEELADIFYIYGEERASRRIARAIVRSRVNEAITTTTQLAAIVERAVGGRKGKRTHPATRVFQALRIAVNGELDELERGLRAGVDLLAPGGRFVVISFHSIEDRIVKRFFAAEVRGCVCPPEVPVCVCGKQPTLKLVGRAVKPSPSEVATNPRSRSAILRIVERLP